MSKTTKQIMHENTEREKAIAPENMEIYTNMIAYIRGANLTERNVETIRADITEMLLDAQLRGDNIQKVFGANYKEICDDIIDAMPKKTAKDQLVEIVDILLRSVWRLGLILLVTNVISDFTRNGTLTTFTVTSGQFISMIIIILVAYGIVMYVTKTALDNAPSKKRNTMEIVGFFALFVLIILPPFFLPATLFEVSYMTAVITIVGLFGASKLVENNI